MCLSFKRYNFKTMKSPTLPDYGWWYYCIKCNLPTFHEDKICNTCKRQEKIRYTNIFNLLY